MENFDEKSLKVSETPHLRSYKKTSNIMFKVFLALCPAAFYGVRIFGPRAAIMILVSIASCLLSETVYNLIMKKKNTVSDGSALVTGMLIAMNVSSLMPYWQVALGCVFAIIIVKQLFGGLGCNFMNPALAGRAFLMASFAGNMTNWAVPGEKYPLFGNLADAVTSPTPLAVAETENAATLSELFFGNTGGCIGETSAFLLILGGIYLIAAGVIRIHIPLSYIGTVFVLTLFATGFDFNITLKYLLSGGLMLGAFFMATDYVTSPMTGKGRIVAGILCGILTVSIRVYGGYPEGVSYSILLMNAATPLIDKVCRQKRFGEVSAWKKKKQA
ncbi:MAG: RnfABCDGE type electron transport complex subunit D [Clostridia bacterium]|nr:RnfABCDGE type electron transport complex subunit D [Clostridia bacterium]